MDKSRLITELLQLSQELAKALTHGHYDLIKKLIELEGAVQTEQNKEEDELIDMAKEYGQDTKPKDEAPPPKKGKTYKPKIDQPDDGFGDDDLGLPTKASFKPAPPDDLNDLPF